MEMLEFEPFSDEAKAEVDFFIKMMISHQTFEQAANRAMYQCDENGNFLLDGSGIPRPNPKLSKKEIKRWVDHRKRNAAMMKEVVKFWKERKVFWQACWTLFNRRMCIANCKSL